jgi:phosphate transport system substrate-binding protein
VKEQPGSASVVDGVAGDQSGIGYSGIGYMTSNVKAVPLAAKAGEPFVAPSGVTVLDGTYPLGRGLFVYVVKMPGQDIDPTVAEFVRFVLSKDGQEIVAKAGEIPLSAEMAEEQLEQLKKK